nr:hypothetical protein [Tanacetum cinerariifolium]
MKRVGKGFSGVETPLFENMLVVRAVDAEEEVQVPAQDDVVQENVIEEVAAKVVPPTPTLPSPPSPVRPSSPLHQSPSPPQSQAAEGSSQLVQQVLQKCSALVLRVKGLENANAAQQVEIFKLKARVKKLERLNKVKSSKLRRLKKVGTSQQVQEAVEVMTTAKLITEVVTAATQIAAASTPIPVAKPKAPVVDYQVVVVDNRPKYKIIRADDTYQFYISFTTLLKNFDREDLEALWRIVK